MNAKGRKNPPAAPEGGGAPAGSAGRGGGIHPPVSIDRAPFLATVMRHELYGALNSITMIAGLMGERGKKGAVDSEELTRMSSRLLKQIERATTIVDHYVELLGPGGSDDDGVTCGAVEIRRALEAEDGAARRHQVKMDLGGLPSDAELAIDPERLRFALRHVIEFAACKGRPVTLAITSEDEDFVTLDIRYPGDALGVDDLHVFERGPRNVPPELIDLAVARRVVTDVGGEVAPRDGQILVRLPRALD